MQVTGLFHVAIKTKSPESTKRFYEEVFGMSEAPRPSFEFPGYWMQTKPESAAVLHVYTGAAALGADGNVPFGNGAIDHIALLAQGFDELRDRCRLLGVPYRERGIPNFPLWQIFIYDPNGIQFEFNFQSAQETDSSGVDQSNFPKAGSEWFDREFFERYNRLNSPAGEKE